MSGALVVLAVAVLLWPQPGWTLRRAAGMRPEDRTAAPGGPVDPFDAAAGYDTFAVCLRSGLPVATAARVAGQVSPAALGARFARAADLLALGSDPEKAWETDDDAPGDFADLAALVRRASRAGAAPADAVAGFADAVRRRAENAALEAAERAGVKISGPLGLCFLPAFVCLGIAPVVIGLATDLLGGL
nr:type II secretion system F family protein [Gordonia shandongensis]